MWFFNGIGHINAKIINLKTLFHKLEVSLESPCIYLKNASEKREAYEEA